MKARHENRRLAPLSLIAAAAILAACGGGGDSTEAASAAAGSPAPAGRASVLSVAPPLLPEAPAGLAGNVVCRNWRIGAVTLDNVEVAPGAACHLDGTVIRGSLQAQRASVIDARDIQVAGSVQSQQGAYLALHGTSRVTGDVQVEDGGGADVRGARIGGSLYASQLSGALRLSDNTIGGNLQVFESRGGGSITGNRINGALQCKGNLPAPVASGNTAASYEDQCAAAGGAGPGAGAGGGAGSSGPGSPAPGLSGNVTCIGLTLGAIRLDSVIVPANATCTLVGTRLIGSVEVGANARLVADGIAVDGNVIADGAAGVMLTGTSTIGGSVQLKRGGPTSVVGADITGDLQIDDMPGAVVASANRVGGSLQAMANRGGLTLTGNRIVGNLQCKDNLPAPVGAGNVASLKQDQCRPL